MKEYQKFGNVIIGWKTSTTKAFAGIIRHFIPPPAVIIDLCAGERRMYRYLNNGYTLNGQEYEFIFGDIRDIKGLDYICDIRNPPAGVLNKADGYVFDPPWPTHSGNFGSMIAKYWPMDKKDFPEFLEDSFNSIHNILKHSGTLIIKCPHPWNHVIYNSLINRNYKWIRDIPQLSIYRGVYLISYFMVFKKSEN